MAHQTLQNFTITGIYSPNSTRMSISIKKRYERTVYLNRALDRGFICRQNDLRNSHCLLSLRYVQHRGSGVRCSSEFVLKRGSTDGEASPKHIRNLKFNIKSNLKKNIAKGTDKTVFKYKDDNGNLENLVLPENCQIQKYGESISFSFFVHNRYIKISFITIKLNVLIL